MVFEQLEECVQFPMVISQSLVSDYRQPTVLIDARTPEGKRKCKDYEQCNMVERLNLVRLCWIGEELYLREQLIRSGIIFVEISNDHRERLDFFFSNFLQWKGRLILVMRRCARDEMDVKRKIHLRYRIAEDNVIVFPVVTQGEMIGKIKWLRPERLNYEGSI